jgi:hypothetical protein
MSFTVRMGVPEMEYYWQDMCVWENKAELDKSYLKTFKKLLKNISPHHSGSVIQTVALFTTKHLA